MVQAPLPESGAPEPGVQPVSAEPAGAPPAVSEPLGAPPAAAADMDMTGVAAHEEAAAARDGGADAVEPSGQADATVPFELRRPVLQASFMDKLARKLAKDGACGV